MLKASTKLNAINTLLSTIGEARVNQLDSGIDEAVEAEEMLDEMSRIVQGIGWDFNTESGVSFPLDAQSRVPLSSHILRIDSNGQRYVRRGGYLYDKRTHSYFFTTPPTITVTYGLDFEDIPEVARQYITVRAARVFQTREVGSTTLNRFNREDEAMAWIALRQFEEASQDLSFFDAPDMQLALDRSTTAFVDYRTGSLIGE